MVDETKSETKSLIDWKSLITGLVGGAIGFVATAVITMVGSAITGGMIIQWMGGLTKADARFQFGGLYMVPDATDLEPDAGKNPLDRDQRSCPDGFGAIKMGRYLISRRDQNAGATIYLCVKFAP